MNLNKRLTPSVLGFLLYGIGVIRIYYPSFNITIKDTQQKKDLSFTVQFLKVR